jgi:hypothetical protein
MLKDATVFVVVQTKGRYQHVVDRGTLRQLLCQQVLAMDKFRVIGFADGVRLVIELHLAHIHYVVLTANEQVYLSTFHLVIAFK